MQFDNPIFTNDNGNTTLKKRPGWYVGSMTRAAAETHLLQATDPQAGDFVVRESSANGNFVISILLDRNTFEHHQLTQDAQVGGLLLGCLQAELILDCFFDRVASASTGNCF